MHLVLWDYYLKEYKRYALGMIILKTGLEVKATVTRKIVCDTPAFQSAFIHRIWNSYLNEYRRYAADSMSILETRSEVKVNVTVA